MEPGICCILRSKPLRQPYKQRTTGVNLQVRPCFLLGLSSSWLSSKSGAVSSINIALFSKIVGDRPDATGYPQRRLPDFHKPACLGDMVAAVRSALLSPRKSLSVISHSSTKSCTGQTLTLLPCSHTADLMSVFPSSSFEGHTTKRPEMIPQRFSNTSDYIIALIRPSTTGTLRHSITTALVQ